MTEPTMHLPGLAPSDLRCSKPRIDASHLPRIIFLDGIRGWASVIVFLSHAIPCFLASKYTFLKTPILIFITDGNFAVSVFFVLSGIALTINYFRTKDTTVLLHLAIRRYPRLLLPIAASTFLGVAFFKLGLFYNHEAAPLLDSQWWLANHFSDKRTLQEILHFVSAEVFINKVHPWGYNINLWTMNIEFLGSFAVIAFCMFIYPLKRAAFLAIPGLIAIYFCDFFIPFFFGVVISRHIHFMVQFSARTRTIERWCIGLSCVMLAATILFSTLSRNLPFDTPDIVRTETLSTLFAGLLVIAVAINKHLRALLSTPLSRYLGHLSFPLYLTHLIVICSFSSFLYLHLQHFQSLVVCLILIPSTTAVSLLVAHAFAPVETCAIALSRRISRFLV